MANEEPLAYFLTWTVYGTHLPGEDTGWWLRMHGEQPPRSGLAHWHRERLKHEVVLLSKEHRHIVDATCWAHCCHRGWTLMAVNARSNHVHAVVQASDISGDKVRDQLKAYCTRALREKWPVFRDRPVWTVGGDWRGVKGDDELEAVCFYVNEGQDRKGKG